MTNQSLYEEIGGAGKIEEVIGDFYRRVFADPDLRPFFDGVDLDQLTNMQREFFAAALGGSEIYSGTAIREAHASHHIEVAHLTRFTDHLLETLGDSGLDSQQVNAIVNRIARHSEDVVGGVAETG